MSPSGPSRFRLLAVAAGCLLALTGLAGNDDTPPRAGEEANPVSFRRLGSSPVEAFRKLLSMTPAERDQCLTNYPAALRQRILDKVEQDQMLPVDFRELRLRVTELRWYLLPLLETPPEQREEKLKTVPEPYRDLVRARLEEWDIWPPDLRTRCSNTKAPSVASWAGMPRERRGPATDRGRGPVRTRPAPGGAEARGMAGHAAGAAPAVVRLFPHYFELSDEEKERTLDALAQPERDETAKVLDSIEKGSKGQQQAYLAAFRKFAEMSATERQQFMQNAQRWQKMSAEERQAWRDLVQQLGGGPPLPPGFIPPFPQPVGSGLSSGARTNAAAAPPK